MNEPTVLVMKDLPFRGAQWDRLIAAIKPDRMVALDPADTAGIDAALQNAEIAILAGDLDQRHIDAPRLKWVHCDHAGLTKSARPEVFAKGIAVTGSAGRSAQALAEHVMMFSLLLTSRYADFYEAQKRQEWLRVPEMSDLRALQGRTMGIIGMGFTGLELAARAKAFNMKVLGYRRRDLPKPPNVDHVYSAERGENIDPILDECDVLALVINLSDATHHLIGQRELARMKNSAILINLSRGAVIDQDALVAALRSGEIAGAGLDVTTPEPLPHGHPLWTMPNVLITPHFSPSGPDKAEKSLGIIMDNLSRFRTGQPMLNRITEADVYSR